MKLNYFNILNKNIYTNTSLKTRRRRYLLESFCKRLIRKAIIRMAHSMANIAPKMLTGLKTYIIFLSLFSTMTHLINVVVAMYKIYKF